MLEKILRVLLELSFQQTSAARGKKIIKSYLFNCVSFKRKLQVHLVKRGLKSCLWRLFLLANERGIERRKKNQSKDLKTTLQPLESNSPEHEILLEKLQQQKKSSSLVCMSKIRLHNDSISLCYPLKFQIQESALHSRGFNKLQNMRSQKNDFCTIFSVELMIALRGLHYAFIANSFIAIIF